MQRTVLITNNTGLHARPAAQFVQAAGKFKSTIKLTMGAREANAKSILGVLSLGASKGAEVTLTVSGEDEQAAMDELVMLIRSNFGEGDEQAI